MGELEFKGLEKDTLELFYNEEVIGYCCLMFRVEAILCMNIIVS